MDGAPGRVTGLTGKGILRPKFWFFCGVTRVFLGEAKVKFEVYEDTVESLWDDGGI